VLLQRRELVGRYIAAQAAALALGVVVFGFNPYVTNTVHRGHPLYPVLGTAAYPSHADLGEDGIEKWETPANMKGRNRVVRLGYALFGRPGAQPFHPGENAEIMIPFDVGWKDFGMYYFHDVRISGFGPLFSGAFLMSLVMLGAAAARPGPVRLAVLITAGTIVLSLLVSEHTWWARYGPQLWWIPVLAVIAGLLNVGPRAAGWSTWALATLLVVNTVPVAFVHFRWEADATRTTNEQLERLRGAAGVLADFQYFGEPFGMRLRNAGVAFTAVDRLPCETPIELMSVSPGYPMSVRVCLVDQASPAVTGGAGDRRPESSGGTE
jgi:hypothetical protein